MGRSAVAPWLPRFGALASPLRGSLTGDGSPYDRDPATLRDPAIPGREPPAALRSAGASGTVWRGIAPSEGAYSPPPRLGAGPLPRASRRAQPLSGAGTVSRYT